MFMKLLQFLNAEIGFFFIITQLFLSKWMPIAFANWNTSETIIVHYDAEFTLIILMI